MSKYTLYNRVKVKLLDYDTEEELLQFFQGKVNDPEGVVEKLVDRTEGSISHGYWLSVENPS